jgi:anti-sigma regulatory factor (Ser/Thr protein kinase)
LNLTRWSARLPGTQRRGGVPAARKRSAMGTPQGGTPGHDGTTGRAASAATGAAVEPGADAGESAGVSGAAGLAGGPAGGPAEAGIGDPAVRGMLSRLPALIAVTHGPGHRVGFVNDAYTDVFGPRPLGARARDALPELAELGLLPLMDQVHRSGRPRTVKARKVLWADAGAGAGSGAGPVPGTGGTASAAGPATVVGAASAYATPSTSATAAGRQPAARQGYFTFTCTPVQADDPDPERRGVLLFGADVTDQVQSAERLRESERRLHETAVTLQRSLLPQQLEQPDDLRVAATYQPGGTDAAVGGDWYDVITLGAGRTAVVIGDVMGRGVRAAAVMGQLRTAVRAYARLDLPPHEVIQLLDGLAAEIDATQIATCVYAVHDPSEGRLTYASAGHLPMLVRDADGTVRTADEPTGPPLGTGGWMHTSGSIALTPGCTAVLYTDGLVERRDQDIDEGIAALTRALAGATGAPQVVCDRLLRTLGVTSEHDDDVAVLVLQYPDHTGSDAELFRNASLELLGGVEAAPRARAFASGVLASWRFPAELRDLGVLAASELVANSLKHGHPPMRLRLRRTDRRLIIEVTDGDDHLPRRRRAAPADETGRGISVIATIASAWGSRRTPGGGKAVWCEFALRG